MIAKHDTRCKEIPQTLKYSEKYKCDKAEIILRILNY